MDFRTIATLLKHPDVYAMTAGGRRSTYRGCAVYAQKRNPRKLMWALDYPILPFDRTLTEATGLPLTGDARTGYLGANAMRVFGSPDSQPETEL